MHVGVLTLTLIGTLRCGRLPLLLVETRATALAGAPTCVVLAGALQPVGHMAQWAQTPQKKSVGGSLSAGAVWVGELCAEY